MADLHECKHEPNAEDVIHYGVSVERCWTDVNGLMWVESHCSEYGNRVNFCPFCGAGATVKFDGFKTGVEVVAARLQKERAVRAAFASLAAQA